MHPPAPEATVHGFRPYSPAMPKRSSPGAPVRDDALGTYLEVMPLKYELTGWKGVLQRSSNCGNLRPVLPEMRHPAIDLLKHLGYHGVPVPMTTPPWSPSLRQERLERGSHKLCDEHFEFLRKEKHEFCPVGLLDATSISPGPTHAQLAPLLAGYHPTVGPPAAPHCGLFLLGVNNQTQAGWGHAILPRPGTPPLSNPTCKPMLWAYLHG
jgi:hypothetical protein